MTNPELLIKSLDSAFFELGEAFKDLPDADVWKRAHPSLLSVGELAVHIAYWEAQSFLGDSFESPLFAKAARYYTMNVTEPFALDLGASALHDEVKRIHEACKAALTSTEFEYDTPTPYREGWTWGYTLVYQAFHVAYYTGQMYSVRHLLGHETVDN